MLYAIVVAGGSGSRMQSATPKQFLPLMGKPVMVHAINTFLQFDEKLKVIVVLPENEQGRQKEILSHVSDSPSCAFYPWRSVPFSIRKKWFKLFKFRWDCFCA
jgi:2-C-methyl-D-erythritol 4-phosphate cytidylyltransferase